jgi:hypothetical protein
MIDLSTQRLMLTAVIYHVYVAIMSFIKESVIAKTDDVFTKHKLVKIRESSEFKSPEDWYIETGLFGRKSIWWTHDGYVKLMNLKEVEQVNDVVKKDKIDQSFGTVKRLYVNKSIVGCFIDGVDGLQMVKVRTSEALRVNKTIPVTKRKDGWVSIFETNEKGKVHA